MAAALYLEVRALRKGAPGTRVVRTGMGPARARRAAARLRKDPARFIAVAGVCGAVDPALSVGDILVASELRRADVPRAVESQSMVLALKQLEVEAHVGPIHSLDHVVRGRERASLHEAGAIAVDMESSWLADAAEGRPVCVVRVVVDAPDAELGLRSIWRNGARALAALRDLAPAFALWTALAESPAGR